MAFPGQMFTRGVIIVQDGGITVVDDVGNINFGVGLSVTDDGNGKVTITSAAGTDILAGIDHILSSETFTIPERRQMHVHGTQLVEGTLIINGTLVIEG